MAHRILIVDDLEPWRRYVRSVLQEEQGLQVIDEACDGLQAVQKTQQLRPDLVLLDIGLPTINGIEAARRSRERSPKSKILFFSENRSSEIVQEALGTGALGYIVKSGAASELLPAVKAVLQGKHFVSASVSVCLNHPSAEYSSHYGSPRKVAPVAPQDTETVGHHEVVFYSDDPQLVDQVSAFIGAALKAGNAAIVIATDSHRDSLIRRFQAYGLDVDADIEQSRYIAVDAAETLSTFLVNGMLVSCRFLESFGSLISTAARAVKVKHARVVVFGEGAHLLWTQGNVQAAIQDEKLCNELTKKYNVDILCGYRLASFQTGIGSHVFEQICLEHSAFYSR